MGNNTEKNSSNMNDGLLGVIGFVSIVFLLFFVAFYMGREIGKNDKTALEEYTKTWEKDREEMAEKLESIESRIGGLESKIGELEGDMAEMREAAKNAESEVNTNENNNGAVVNPNVS